MRTNAISLPLMHKSSGGFTLVEMVMVIVITGIIGGMVAVFLRTPIQQYMDVGRRAEITDIADTALRRIGRDLRTALPNSVRVAGACGGATCYLEFLPTTGGGRYRAGAGGTDDVLDFTAADSSFEVLGTMPPAGTSVVVYNMTSNPADLETNAYVGGNRTSYTGVAGSILSFAPKLFPWDSPNHRFYLITTPVTFACDPVAGTLTRWRGYAIQAAQPVALPGGGGSDILANNVSDCSFRYDPLVSPRNGLVSMNLAITKDGETVTLYSATHVSNMP